MQRERRKPSYELCGDIMQAHADPLFQSQPCLQGYSLSLPVAKLPQGSSGTACPGQTASPFARLLPLSATLTLPPPSTPAIDSPSAVPGATTAFVYPEV